GIEVIESCLDDARSLDDRRSVLLVVPGGILDLDRDHRASVSPFIRGAFAATSVISTQVTPCCKRCQGRGVILHCPLPTAGCLLPAAGSRSVDCRRDIEGDVRGED